MNSFKFITHECLKDNTSVEWFKSRLKFFKNRELRIIFSTE